MKIIAKIFVVILCVLILFVVSSVTLTVIYRNDIVSAALEAVARSNELSFKSQSVDVAFSFKLKNTALLFGNVDVKSRKSVSDVTLALQAETLRVEVDLLRFALYGEVSVKKLAVKNGQLSLRLASRGRRGSPDASPQLPDTEALLYGVSKIQLERCRLSVEDASGGSVAVEVEALSADMEQKGEKLNLHAKGLMAVQASGGKKPAQRTLTKLSVDVRGSLAQGVATVADGKLSVNGVALEATGSVAFRPLGEVDARITGKNLSLEHVVGQARKYVELDAPERLSGRADVKIRLSGSLKEKSTLRLTGAGAVRNAALKLKGMEEFSAKELTCSISSHDVKNLRSYACDVSSGNVLWRNFRFSGEGAVRNFASPVYDLNVGFLGDVAALKVGGLLEGSVQGTAQLRTTAWSYEGVEALGVRADVVNFKALIFNELYTFSGQLSADKNVLEPQLNVACSAAEGAFSGAVQGYLKALLDESPATLKISGNLAAKRLDLDKLLAQGDSSASDRLSIYANLNAQADELTVLGDLYTNASGAVSYSSRSLLINKLSVDAFGGTLGGDVKLYSGAGGRKRLGCDLYFNSLQLESLPYLHKKFGVKPGSVQGKCSGAITLASDVNSEGPDMDKLAATLNFTVSNGRLLEFAPIQPLSAYLKKSLLQDVRFSALKNTLSLENGKITIPKMEVRSTALNAIIAGTQELKGDFDYHITLYLNELFSRKEKDIENPIKEDKTKLFLRFTGKNGVTEVTHDAREWSKNMEKKAQREAQEIRSLLRNGQEADKNPPTTAPKTKKITVEWEEDESVGAPEKTPEKPKQKPEKPAQKKQRSEVEVEWDE
ncbi:MAG: AsmA-like C-terminal region-containing protein [Prevotellaceae bacterium]|nr:AsmA-like C-terminal region-containing protein [Prevotellaceae bacterium]